MDDAVILDAAASLLVVTSLVSIATRCAPAPTSAPTSTPTMAPTPAPTGPLPTPSPTSPTPPTHSCPGGSMAACLQLCPSDMKGYEACAKECNIRCGQEIVI